MQKMIDLLWKADGKIKRKHRYPCGLETETLAGELQSNTGVHADRARYFFSSPDGQNGELYYALRALGLESAGYNAEYYWKLRDPKTGWMLSYTEGDVDIYQATTSLPASEIGPLID